MGTICAPSYANIFMGKFESTNIYPYIREKTTTYLGYIDYLFFIWKGKKEELLSLIEDLNKKHPFLKVNFKYSLEFLYTKR